MKIVKDARNAVDVEQVKAFVKTGSVGSTGWLMDVYLTSGDAPAPFIFATEIERDKFYEEMLSAMGG